MKKPDDSNQECIYVMGGGEIHSEEMTDIRLKAVREGERSATETTCTWTMYIPEEMLLSNWHFWRWVAASVFRKSNKFTYIGSLIRN
jgi:hypothetical protein